LAILGHALGIESMRKTFSMKTDAAVSARSWQLVDVAGMTLGRAATQIAHVLRGKHKPTYTPHVDAGDFVVVLNADKIALTGNKMKGKLYYRHSLHPGGLTTFTAEQLLNRNPTELIQRAVWGMLPKGPLGRRIYKKLKVYASDKHPHAAQTPAELKLQPAR